MANVEGFHVLVVDDDARLRDLLQRYLVQHGYLVSVAADGAAALAALERIAFDIVVLDVMLPDRHGVDLVAELRRRRDVPILLLTALGEPEHRIRGLEAGADDYLAKPFEPRELLLRIANILRRAPSVTEPMPVRFGPYRFDPATLELTRDGEPVRLTAGEAALLRCLALQPGRALSRAELGARARLSGSDRAVDVQMVRLRRKLEEDPRRPRWLLTLRGAGYVLRPGS